MYVYVCFELQLLQGAMTAAEPVCLGGPCNSEEMDNILVANSTLIENLLECFLVNPNCSLFQSVLARQLAVDNLYQSMQANLHNYYYTFCTCSSYCMWI